MSSGYCQWRSLLIAVQVFTLVACGSQTDDSEDAPTTAVIRQLMDASDLGSTLGTPVAESITCGAPNQWTSSCAFSNAPEINYYWTAPCAGTFTFTTFGSAYDTLLHIRSMPDLVQLGCNDDAGGTFQSSVTLALSVGQRIYISVDGYAGHCGWFQLNTSGSCGTWTGWDDRDNPSGSGDWETRVDRVPPVCANPIDVQCQTLTGIDWTQTGEVATCTLDGFICMNANQSDGVCQDYWVRYLCP